MMKYVTNRILSLAIAVLITTQAFVWGGELNIAKAQESTPSVDYVSEGPKFAILPVGDFSNGLFDNVEINPGSTIMLNAAVVNMGSAPIELYTYKVNAISGVNGGFVPGEEGDSHIGATAWIDYQPQLLTVDPGEERILSFEVSVPEGTAAGQYVTSLLVRTAESVAIPGSDILTQVIRYAVMIEVIVPGEMNPSFDVGEPETVDRLIRVPVTNSGNYLVKPNGELKLVDSNGNTVLRMPVNMGSVYTGLSTTIDIPLAEQLAPGEYTLTLDLSDPGSGVSASIEGTTITVEEPVDPTGVFVTDAAIEPNAEEIVFANVDVTLNNGGQQIPASNVVLEVMRDGEQVDTFPLATNQVLLNGENQFTTRYIPAEMWASGTYTFAVVVSAVDPNGGQETILLDQELDATIVVP